MRSSFRGLAAGVAAVVALCASVGCTSDNEAAATSTAEIGELIADYREARGLDGSEEFDRDGFLSLVTTEFNETLHMYYQFGGDLRMTGTHSTPVDEFYTMSPWELESDGDLVVAGDGPWFASAVEIFVDSRERYEGTATYVIVDEGGTLKIAEYHWIGVYGEGA